MSFLFLSYWELGVIFLMQEWRSWTNLRGTGLHVAFQVAGSACGFDWDTFSVFTLRSLVFPILFCPTPGLFACVLGLLLSIVRCVGWSHVEAWTVLHLCCDEREALTTSIALDTWGYRVTAVGECRVMWWGSPDCVPGPLLESWVTPFVVSVSIWPSTACWFLWKWSVAVKVDSTFPYDSNAVTWEWVSVTGTECLFFFWMSVVMGTVLIESCVSEHETCADFFVVWFDLETCHFCFWGRIIVSAR